MMMCLPTLQHNTALRMESWACKLEESKEELIQMNDKKMTLDGGVKEIFYCTFIVCLLDLIGLD